MSTGEDVTVKTRDEVVKPLNFKLEEKPNAYWYGQIYFAIGLSDGREVMVHADSIEISPRGDLFAASDTKFDSASGMYAPVPKRNVLILPAGLWVHCYTASVHNGSPLAIDGIYPPTLSDE